MPQFQLLEEQPSFQQQLGQQIGTGAARGLQQSLEQFHEKKQQEALGNQFESIGLPRELAGLDPQIIKQFMAAQQKQSLMQQLLGAPQGAAETLQAGETPGVGLPPQPPQEISARDVEAAMLVDPNLGRVRQQERKLQERQKETTSARSFKRSLKYLEKQADIAAELPKERLALAQMQAALDSGDFNSLRNAIGEITGQQFLKTASAQTVNSASKQFLMSSLAGMTGRPNVFIEKQITKGLISPLYKDAANRLILEGYKGLFKLKEKQVQITDELEEKYTSEGKEIPRNFQKLVRQKMQKETRDFEKSYQNMVIELLDLKKSPSKRTGGDLIRRTGIKGQTITNPNTGEKMILRDGKWQVL